MRPVNMAIIAFVAGFFSLPLARLVFSKPPQPEKEEAPAIEQVTNPTLEPRNIQRMKVTAYCPCNKCCGQYADGKTSTGKDAWKPGVAADPKLLPYGTKLNIPGVGILPVDDTGGAMRQSAKKGICHIDVRFPDHREALNFGVKWLDVEVLN